VDRRGPRSAAGRVVDVAWASRFNVNHRVASSPRRGQSLLCGDAAHVRSPAGGQGMNTWIQEAVSLARALVGNEPAGRAGRGARHHDGRADAVEQAGEAVGIPQSIPDRAACDPRRLRHRRDPAPACCERFRRCKAAATSLVQYRTDRFIAELDGGDVDHPTYLQSNASFGNPP